MTVLLAPLRTEAAAVRLGARGARIERIGMGPARAEIARVKLSRSVVTGVPMAVIGFAGGLSRTDRAGDLVVATEIRVADGSAPPIALDPELAEHLRAQLALRRGRVRTGAVVCTRTLTKPADRAELASSGASACEMESAWLGPLANGRPFAVIRAIVDFPGRELMSPFTITGGVVAFRRLVAAAAVVHRVLSEHVSKDRLS